MPRRVVKGEPLLPHLTAEWFNKTLSIPGPQPQAPPQKNERPHCENLAVFIATEEHPTAERFSAVAPTSLADTYGNKVSRTHYVDKASLTKTNWIVTQGAMDENIKSQKCVYAGITLLR